MVLFAMATVYARCYGNNWETEWFIFSDESREKYGFFNPAIGQTLYFGMIEGEPYSIVNGVFSVRNGYTKTVYSAADPKAPKVLGDLTDLYNAGQVADGLLPVARSGVLEVYSVSDDEISLAFTLDSINGKKLTFCSGAFADGLLFLEDEDHMHGAVDKTGKVVIPFDYLSVYDQVSGMVVVQKGRHEYCVLNTKGEEIVGVQHEGIPVLFSNGYVFCSTDNGGHRLYNPATKDIIELPDDVDYMYSFEGEYAIYFDKNCSYSLLRIKDGKASIVDTQISDNQHFEPLVPIQLPWNPSLVLCENDEGKCYVRDPEGNVVMDFFDYDFVGPSDILNWEGFIVGDLSSGREVFLDTNGKKIYESHDFYNLTNYLVGEFRISEK